MMPKRPRQHQLETASRNAFRAAVPDRWVVRDLDQDYGIDQEVEIFDAKGQATGGKFLVQLKATDEPDVEKALRFPIKLDKGDYYDSLDLPVLLVKYHAPSKKLFVRWFHSLDAFYASRGRTQLTFRLSEENEWTDLTPTRLEKELQAYREARSPKLAMPITFNLQVHGEEIHGISAIDLVAQVREAVSSPRIPIEVVDPDDPDAALHTVLIDAGKIEVLVGGMPGFTLHTLKGYPEEKARTLYKEVLVCIALALDRHGHSRAAVPILEEWAQESVLLSSAEGALHIASCFARGDRVVDAARICSGLLKAKGEFETLQFLLFPILAAQDKLTAGERELGVRILQELAAQQESDTINAAILHYNCGNLLRTGDRFREAIHHYRKAAALDPGYRDRPYWCVEFAGMLFLCHRYKAAVSFYKSATRVSNDDFLQCLLADALMFAGEFAEAESKFNEFATPGRMRDAEWVLRAKGLAHLRGLLGIDSQDRSRSAANAVLDKAPDGPPARETCLEVLQSDALNGLAWFNLGGCEFEEGNFLSACRCYLLAALVMPWDLDAWINASECARGAGELGIGGLILTAATARHGERLGHEFARRVEKAKDFKSASVIAKGFREAVDLVRERRGPLHVRLHQPDGSYDEILLNKFDGKR